MAKVEEQGARDGAGGPVGVKSHVEISLRESLSANETRRRNFGIEAVSISLLRARRGRATVSCEGSAKRRGCSSFSPLSVLLSCSVLQMKCRNVLGQKVIP